MRVTSFGQRRGPESAPTSVGVRTRRAFHPDVVPETAAVQVTVVNQTEQTTGETHENDILRDGRAINNNGRHADIARDTAETTEHKTRAMGIFTSGIRTYIYTNAKVFRTKTVF